MKFLFSLFKKRLIRITFIIHFIAGGAFIYQQKQNSENPICKDCNLILISVDTLRADHMGVYGYEKNTTPNIDKWAKSATVFTNMHTGEGVDQIVDFIVKQGLLDEVKQRATC